MRRTRTFLYEHVSDSHVRIALTRRLDGDRARIRVTTQPPEAALLSVPIELKAERA